MALRALAPSVKENIRTAGYVDTVLHGLLEILTMATAVWRPRGQLPIVSSEDQVGCI